jgi:hypothetical protein
MNCIGFGDNAHMNLLWRQLLKGYTSQSCSAKLELEPGFSYGGTQYTHYLIEKE